MTGRRVSLVAVIPSEEQDALRVGARAFRFVECGPVLAVVRDRMEGTGTRAALRHASIVARALTFCSSVVPFRLGIELVGDEAVHELLQANLNELQTSLEGLKGRVEMGLKARLALGPSDSCRLAPALCHLGSLAPRREHRRERFLRTADSELFEGCYLISRRDIESFWTTTDEIRRATPDLRLVVSGPWAAYSFCDLALNPVRGAPLCSSDAARSLA